MTAPEYIQLKAFARLDGALLSMLWIGSFACYIAGLASPGYGLAAAILAVATPFVVGSRLRRFRDNGLDGTISLLRGWAYATLVFFYAGLIFALAQWAYFTYLDQGFLVGTIEQVMASPETADVVRQMGLEQTVDESLLMLGSMRPIDLALNVLTTNMMIGIVLGLPLAALMRRPGTEKERKNN